MTTCDRRASVRRSEYVSRLALSPPSLTRTNAFFGMSELEMREGCGNAVVQRVRPSLGIADSAVAIASASWANGRPFPSGNMTRIVEPDREQLIVRPCRLQEGRHSAQERRRLARRMLWLRSTTSPSVTGMSP